MSRPATTLCGPPTPAAPSDWARPLIDRQLAILGRLAEAGLEIAVALEAQAKGGDEVVQGDVALAYSRVARAVRQTLMLQAQLIADLHEQERAGAGRKAAARASAARIVRGVIEDDRANDAERAERLRAEAAERLEREDFDLDVRPFGAVVAQICRDLGLAPDWLALAERCASAQGALDGQGGAAAGEPDGEGPVEMYWLDENGRPTPAWGGLSPPARPPDGGAPGTD